MRLMQRVPYEGVSRMTTSMKRKHRDRVVRRRELKVIEHFNAHSYSQQKLTCCLYLSIAGVSASSWSRTSTPPRRAASTLPTSSSPSG